MCFAVSHYIVWGSACDRIYPRNKIAAVEPVKFGRRTIGTCSMRHVTCVNAYVALLDTHAHTHIHTHAHMHTRTYTDTYTDTDTDTDTDIDIDTHT